MYKEESMPVGCVPLVCRAYVSQWPSDVSTGGPEWGGRSSSNGQV